MTVSFISAWGILLKGGPMMWVIFILSVLAISVGIEKLLFLSTLERDIKVFRSLFLNAVRENRMKDALVLCEENVFGIGQICKAGLMRYGSSVESISSAMREAASVEVHAVKKRLDLMVFIVNAAPLLGLLGTTTSLCVVFHAVQMRSNALYPLSLGDMSSGIWQALLTTSAGLAVGVVSFAMYSFIISRVNGLIIMYEQTISDAAGILQAVAQVDLSQGENPL